MTWPIIIRSKQKMYSFNSQANSSYFGPEAANQQPPSAAFSKQSQQRQEPSSENNSDILTPNFNDFPSSIGSENLFDAYHQQFAERSNNLSKLISTFEGLGLDIEYLEESEEQCAENSSEQHFHHPHPPKALPVDEQLDRAEPMIFTVSRSPKHHFSNRQRHHLDSLKINCKTIRTHLASFLQSLQSFQKQTKNIFASAHGYFTKFLTRYYQAVEASFSSCPKCLNLQRDCQYLQKDNVQLYKIVAAREDRIRVLLKENNQLSGENQKLHDEFEAFTRMHRNCRDLAKENEELQRLFEKTETKAHSLDLQLNEMTQKNDQLQRKLKDLQRQSQINNFQHQLAKEGFEKKFERMLNQSVKEITHKAEVEAYYRAKHQYPLKDFDFRPPQIQEKLTFSCQYGKTLEPVSRSQTYQSYAPSYERQSSVKMINSESKKSTSFYREDTCHSSSIIEDERRVDKILDDIRKMKNSRDPISLHSSCRYLGPTRKASQQLFK